MSVLKGHRTEMYRSLGGGGVRGWGGRSLPGWSGIGRFVLCVSDVQEREEGLLMRRIVSALNILKRKCVGPS